MGEAKRRKKNDPNYGKSSVSVRLDPDLVLSTSLLKTLQLLQGENKKIEKGIVKYKDVDYPVLFAPYTQTYRGKTQLYSHILFDPKLAPSSLNQKTTDRISHLACLEIIAKHQKTDGVKEN